MAEETKPALLLEFSGTASIRAEVDPVEFYRAMTSPLYRAAYLRWDAAQDEYYQEAVPAWMKPYAYLVAHFIETVEIDAHCGRGFNDRSDFEHDDDEVGKRAGQYQSGRDARKWTETDYRVLLAAVPWLAQADDSEVAQEIARCAPMPGDQPMFDVPDGGGS